MELNLQLNAKNYKHFLPKYKVTYIYSLKYSTFKIKNNNEY